MGMGDVIQSVKALARGVSCGLISCFIAPVFICLPKIYLKNYMGNAFKGYLHILSVIYIFGN
jgi:hypothetical protein